MEHIYLEKAFCETFIKEHRQNKMKSSLDAYSYIANRIVEKALNFAETDLSKMSAKMNNFKTILVCKSQNCLLEHLVLIGRFFTRRMKIKCYSSVIRKAWG